MRIDLDHRAMKRLNNVAHKARRATSDIFLLLGYIIVSSIEPPAFEKLASITHLTIL
jgi:hypothetical protein